MTILRGEIKVDDEAAQYAIAISPSLWAEMKERTVTARTVGELLAAAVVELAETEA
jgi:predicted nuclease with RNAse H fold